MRKITVIAMLVFAAVLATGEVKINKIQMATQNKTIVEKQTPLELTDAKRDKLEDLVSWVGEYPYDRKKHRVKNFLEEPLIKDQALKLMGKKLYKRLIVDKDFLVSPIDLEEGFFILDYTANWHKKDYGDSVTILVNKANGDIHVVLYFLPFWEDRVDNIRWLHSQSSEIPDKVIKKLYWLNRSN